MPFGGDSKLHDDKINNPDVSEHEVHPLNISDDERRRLEKKLVRKIDLRMLILVVMFVDLFRRPYSLRGDADLLLTLFNYIAQLHSELCA